MKDNYKDMQSDPRLMGTEKWYDFTREEQQENMLMRIRLIYDKFRDKYFTNFKFSFLPWYTVGFQGVVSINYNQLKSYLPRGNCIISH